MYRLAVACSLLTLCLVAVSPGRAADLESVVIQGTLSGEQFGAAVDRIGDINGDGRDDFAVGSPQGVGTNGKTGVVLVYFGREGVLPAVADLIVDGEVSGDEFGAALAGIGDIDKDGWDDFLVGAPGRDAAGSNSGRVYLYLGGAQPSGSPVKTWDGDCPAARLGAAVAGGFDFDDDGRPDFAVGSPDHNCSGSKAGQVRIYRGSSSGYAAEMHRFHGSPNWALGTSVHGIGDWNDDGVDDVAAGAPQPHDLNSGRVMVWFGQATVQPPPESLEIVGQTGTDRFGWSLAGAGDINRDGVDDLVVGAPGVGSDNGGVYLFFGGSTADAAPDWSTQGATANRELGYRVDGGLDVNGDGQPDFIAGEPGANTFGAGSGGARVWFGKANPTSGGDRVLEPKSPRPSFEAGDAFGTSLAFIGSFDGDGTTEIMVGAPLGDGDGGPVGYVNFFFDPDRLVPVELLSLTATATGDEVVVTWDLVDDGGLAGIRVEALDETGTRPVHPGWLDASVREVRDSNVRQSSGTYRLHAMDRLGNIRILGSVRVEFDPVQILGSNPFQAQLHLSVPHRGGRLRVDVLDVRGRRIRALDLGALDPGPVAVTWDGLDDSGRPAPPGVYFLRLSGGAPPIKVVRIL